MLIKLRTKYITSKSILAEMEEENRKYGRRKQNICLV